jgi:HSP20 family protein
VSMSDKATDEVTKFYFAFEQVVSKRQTSSFKVVKRSLWEPPTNVYETAEGLLIRVEIAGMRESRFEITLLENALIIGGVRPRPESDRPIQAIHQLEIPYGEFRTSISLPFAVKAEEAQARYRDGFLDIELPRAD